MGEDRRPYITLRRKQEIRKDKKEATEHIGTQIKNRVEDSSVGEERKAEIKWAELQTTISERKEEEVQIPDYRDREIDGLIREYKKNSKPTQSAIKIL